MGFNSKFGVRLQRTLASLKREYETESRKSISDSIWYYRLTPELVEFLQKCVIHGMEELAKEPGRKFSKKLETFQDFLIRKAQLFVFTPLYQTSSQQHDQEQ